MAVRETIEVIGAKQNNLKNISVEIPRDKLTVITGVSGSGKSSLAFDVIYGEAQRRFLSSISNFAKSRINQIKKPKVDFVRGLSPVIAIEQKKGNKNPRSTVGTVTDINDYLRLLFATVGVGKCPVCGHSLHQLSAAQIAERCSSLPIGTVVELLTPVYKIYGENYGYLFKQIREKGFKKLLIDGQPFDLSDKSEIDENKNYKIEIIIDKFTIKQDIYMQIAKSIETAMAALNEDYMIRIKIDGKIPKDFFKGFGCPDHHYILSKLQAFNFSFNVPANACSTCAGIGRSYVVEPRFLVVNPDKSIMKGALKTMLFQTTHNYKAALLYSVCEKYHIDMNKPFNELPKEAIDIIFYGTKGESVTFVQPPFSKRRSWIVGRSFPFGGFVNDIGNWYRDYMRRSITGEGYEPGFINETMIEKICPECHGARLKKQRLDVTVDGKNIDEICRMQLPDIIKYLEKLTFGDDDRDVAFSIITEINTRLQLLVDIGLHYLNLGRRSDSISGGEMQRIKMSTQISSELMGMLYVMDEPSIGLHARDSIKVINIMKKLRDLGNTVIVVEHDVETMRHADYLIEIGPGPGIHGGNIVSAGSYDYVYNDKNSTTGDYLSGKRYIPVNKNRRIPSEKSLTLQGCTENNLKNITVEFPLNVFICVTGVSGSGKSTLINETLFKQLEVLKKLARIVPGKHEFLFGSENINSVINIDQSAIGRGSKSNPATYIGIYDKIRDLFANTDDAIAKGYKALDFSLTHSNGTRCEHCYGDGVIVTNLQFMSDIETICPVCKGTRFNEEGLEVKYHGKNISEVLHMTVEEALEFFDDNKYLKHKLGIMQELGLGYLTLGQSSTTLSGGEAQRVKLTYELAKIKRGSHNLYILDEPTTGLHVSDIRKLLDCINKLVDSGHTVIVIEHNMDVIKSADYIIDIGPEGGNEGGNIVAAGTPEEVAKVKSSYTGRFLKEELSRH